MVVTVLGAAAIVFLAVRASQGGAPGIGPLGGLHEFAREETTQVALSPVTQIQICDKIGNISLKVDPNVPTTTVKTKKIVHKASQADADQAFERIIVEVEPPGTVTSPLTCSKSGPQATPTSSSTSSSATGNAETLTVNVTIPDSEGLLRTTRDAVDVTITVPQRALPDDIASMLINIEAPVGNITIDGFSGVMKVNGSTGNVKVTHGVLAAGSQIATAQGNVSFDGWLLPPAKDVRWPRYLLQSEKGNIDVTLPGNTNVTLDANINIGTIQSDFPIKVHNSNGDPVNYHGPLNTQAGPPTATKLVLDVSTGNITIHRSQIRGA
jgi:hypothetical protein